MRITLNTETELINYFNFLHQKGLLVETFPDIILDGPEVVEYIAYALHDPTAETEDYTPNASYEEWNGKKRWSEEDIDQLQKLISEEYSIENIATKMKRTPKAIRHQARASCDMIYRNDSWTNL